MHLNCKLFISIRKTTPQFLVPDNTHAHFLRILHNLFRQLCLHCDQWKLRIYNHKQSSTAIVFCLFVCLSFFSNELLYWPGLPTFARFFVLDLWQSYSNSMEKLHIWVAVLFVFFFEYLSCRMLMCTMYIVHLWIINGILNINRKLVQPIFEVKNIFIYIERKIQSATLEMIELLV